MAECPFVSWEAAPNDGLQSARSAAPGAAAAMVHIVHNVSGVADLDRHFLLCSEGLCGVLSAVRGRSATVVKTFTSLGAEQ